MGESLALEKQTRSSLAREFLVQVRKMLLLFDRLCYAVRFIKLGLE